MTKRLKDNVSSRYLDAANRLNSKRARRRIVAFVESYDDVFFWRTVLSRFETDKLYFEVMLPSHDHHLERGKKAVMMKLLEGKTGQSLIACVDADYDYLVQGATATSHEILSNPYIFHTYAYAIENLQCYAPSLHDVAVAVTLNDHHLFDIEGFLQQFSEIIFPLFVWNIWYYRRPDYNQFPLSSFLTIIELGNFSIPRAGEILARLRHKVNRKRADLRRRHPDAQQSYEQVKHDLLRLGVTPQNTYLYIQGHHLFDKVVVPMLKRICDQLVRERQVEIAQQSRHGTQRRNELSCYERSLEDISSMLKKNAGGMAAPEFHHIQTDVATFVEKLNGKGKE